MSGLQSQFCGCCLALLVRLHDHVHLHHHSSLGLQGWQRSAVQQQGFVNRFVSVTACIAEVHSATACWQALHRPVLAANCLRPC